METPVKREGRPAAAAAAASGSPAGATFGANQFSAAEADRITEMLDRKLSRQDVATRVGSGNARVTYLEGHKAVEITNAVFGFNGWSDNISDVTVDFCDEDRGKFNVGISAIVRVTLRDGTYHEDIGYGLGTNPRKGEALEKAKKEAITDARKRALRLFGNALGNSLYDKGYLAELAQGKGAQEPVIDRKRKREAADSASPVPASPAGSTFVPSGSASSPMLPPPPRALATPASPAAAGSGAGGGMRQSASPAVPPYSPVPAAAAPAASPSSHPGAVTPFNPAPFTPAPVAAAASSSAAAASASHTPLAPPASAAAPAAVQFKLSPPRPHQVAPATVVPVMSPAKPPQHTVAATRAAAAVAAPASGPGGRAQFHAPANAKGAGAGVQFGGKTGAALPATKSPQRPQQPLVVFPPGQQQQALASPNGRPAAAAAAAPAASQIPASLPALEPQPLGPGPAGPASLSPAAAATVGFATATSVMSRGDSAGRLSQGVGDEALNSLMDQVDATESQAAKRLRTA